MSIILSNKKYIRIVNIAFVVLLITVLIPNKGKFKYEYQRGRPWLYETLVAPVDFPILKSDTELRNERNKVAADISPNYNHKSDTGVLSEISTLLRENLPDSASSKLYETIYKLYRNGIADELPDSSYTGGVITMLSDGEKLFVQQKRYLTVVKLMPRSRLLLRILSRLVQISWTYCSLRGLFCPT